MYEGVSNKVDLGAQRLQAVRGTRCGAATLYVRTTASATVPVQVEDDKDSLAMLELRWGPSMDGGKQEVE